jgi:hypothetical protein
MNIQKRIPVDSFANISSLEDKQAEILLNLYKE